MDIRLLGDNFKAFMSALGQKQTSENVWTMSALPPKADIAGRRLDVRFVPKADSCTATTDVYSITASARATTAGGISSPMALAVFRLMTNSNLVGCNTGRSAGFSPFEQSCRSERIATVNELN
jgi:hypothetical protein